MDLTERLGFKAELNLDTGEIHFPDLKPGKVLERKLSDMQQVLTEQPEMENDPLVHRIYRLIGDTPEIINSGLKLDLTVVLPQPFGKEFPKTTGHYHLPLEYARGIPSPDFYQVVHGKGILLLQSENADGTVQAYEVNSEEMQHVLIPLWMGHLTINIGSEPLVFANICIRLPHLDYEPYSARRGAAYYLIRDGTETRFVTNPNYQGQSLRELNPKPIQILSGFDGKPFYPLLTEQTDKLRFLVEPQNYIDLFKESLK